MFLPEAQADKQRADEERKVAFRNIEAWSLELIPVAIRNDATVSVQEVQCRDPQCSPIDTAVTILYRSGSNGMFGLPMEAREVTNEELHNKFPTNEVLEKWHRGEDAEWPPAEKSVQVPELRFVVGTRVLCRIGPDVDRDWAPGVVMMLWYREATWPHGSFAPYQIRLDDGRSIFAPGDIDQVIRRQPF